MRDAFGLERLDQVEQAVQRVEVGSDLGDLRADVAVDADHLEARQRRCAPVRCQRLVVRDAELVALQAGRDVGVRLGVDVGVDAQADRRVRPLSAATSDSVCSSASLSTLKHRTPASSARRISCALSCRRRRTRPWSASPPAASTRSSSPPETMSKPQPACGEGLQHRQGRVGLHRIADQVRRGRPARAGSAASAAQHGAARIDVQRRADARAPARRAARPSSKSSVAAPGEVRRAGQRAHRGAVRWRRRRVRGRRQRQRPLLAAGRQPAPTAAARPGAASPFDSGGDARPPLHCSGA